MAERASVESCAARATDATTNNARAEITIFKLLFNNSVPPERRQFHHRHTVFPPMRHKPRSLIQPLGVFRTSGILRSSSHHFTCTSNLDAQTGVKALQGYCSGHRLREIGSATRKASAGSALSGPGERMLQAALENLGRGIELYQLTHPLAVALAGALGN